MKTQAPLPAVHTKVQSNLPPKAKVMIFMNHKIFSLWLTLAYKWRETFLFPSFLPSFPPTMYQYITLLFHLQKQSRRSFQCFLLRLSCPHCLVSFKPLLDNLGVNLLFTESSQEVLIKITCQINCFVGSCWQEMVRMFVLLSVHVHTTEVNKMIDLYLIKNA